jgi:histidinol phosphatase-like PHP family hydrolase
VTSFIFEEQFMKYQVDHDLHIHSNLSSCANDPEQTPLGILRYAQRVGLKQICLTNHYLDRTRQNADTPNYYLHQDYDHNAKALPLPQADGVEFLFGCETDMTKYNTVGIPKSRYKEFDMILIPIDHFHMKGFTISKKDYPSIEGQAKRWVQRFDHLMHADLPFHKLGLAHLATACMHHPNREKYLQTLDAISNDDLYRLIRQAAAVGCGIELNLSDMDFAEHERESVMRMFHIAKECGCKFYLGSDAHHPDKWEKFVPLYTRAVDILDLQESDKFQLK